MRMKMHVILIESYEIGILKSNRPPQHSACGHSDKNYFDARFLVSLSSQRVYLVRGEKVGWFTTPRTISTMLNVMMMRP